MREKAIGSQVYELFCLQAQISKAQIDSYPDFAMRGVLQTLYRHHVGMVYAHDYETSGCKAVIKRQGDKLMIGELVSKGASKASKSQ